MLTIAPPLKIYVRRASPVKNHSTKPFIDYFYSKNLHGNKRLSVLFCKENVYDEESSKSS